MSMRAVLAIPLAFSLVAGCKPQGDLTYAEAQQASEEIQTDTQAQALTSSTVEIGTNFTIGDAVEQAAQNIRAFVQAELPCAAVTIAGSTLTITYGAQGSCPWNGMTFTGTHRITVTRNDQSQVLVSHSWTNLSNGKVEVTGTADVTWTWDPKDPNRHVVHDLIWTRLSDGRTGEGKGDRTQIPLAGGIKVGFQEDGHRSWDGRAGHWNLDISGLQMRWVDPVPQAGSLTLDTPFNKTVALDFLRLDATTIKITVQGPANSFDFNVKSLR